MMFLHKKISTNAVKKVFENNSITKLINHEIEDFKKVTRLIILSLLLILILRCKS